MERTDSKKTVHRTWEGNYNTTRSETIDASTTELSGSRREVDLIVRGLQALRAQIILNEAAGVGPGYEAYSEYGSLKRERPVLAEVEGLLASVATPNYVGEPVVENR